MIETAVKLELDQSASVGPQLYRHLRGRIIKNDLPPGTRVSETEIAAVYSVSRQPAREAFIKLAEEGLVEVRPQRGTFISKISIDAVMDARFVREAVEADVVKLLAIERDDSLILALEAQLDAQRAIVGKDPDKFIGLDEEFHRAIAQAAGKERVWKKVEGFKAQMDRVRYLSLVRHFPTDKLLSQHEAITKAIADRDPITAEAVMRGHLREILNDLLGISAEHPELFKGQAV